MKREEPYPPFVELVHEHQGILSRVSSVYSSSIEDREDLYQEILMQKRLRFHRTKYEIWLWMIALTTVFLSFAVSTTVDAQDGQYRINRPAVFIGVTVAQFLFMYTALKVGQYPIVRESKAILSDLEHQVTTETAHIKVLRSTWRLWGILFTVLFVVLLILGIYRALSWPG